jgi:hypothetical protein
MSRLEKMLVARSLLMECGNYDNSILGALGEVYAEEELGMTKAERGQKGYDGLINNRRVQVKAKEYLRDAKSQSYVAINLKNINSADDLIVVYFKNDGSLSHFGPVSLEGLHKMGYYKDNATQRRYGINKIMRFLEEESGV